MCSFFRSSRQRWATTTTTKMPTRQPIPENSVRFSHQLWRNQNVWRRLFLVWTLASSLFPSPSDSLFLTAAHSQHMDSNPSAAGRGGKKKNPNSNRSRCEGKANSTVANPQSLTPPCRLLTRHNRAGNPGLPQVTERRVQVRGATETFASHKMENWDFLVCVCGCVYVCVTLSASLR